MPALAIAVCLAAPGGAAAYEIGSNQLGVDHDQMQVCTGYPSNANSCIGTQDEIDGDNSVNVVPSGYRILTSFSFQSDKALSLVILRQSGSSFSRVRVVGPYQGNGLNTVRTVNTRFPVQAGDFIGVRLPANGGRIGAVTDTFGDDTNAWEMSDVVSPVIQANDPNLELLLNAEVEPDDDGDGYGDDSQDCDYGTGAGCGSDGGGSDDGGYYGDSSDFDSTSSEPEPDPLAPLRAGKKPNGKILGKRYKVSKKGVVKVKVKNTNGFTIKGKLTLKAKRLKVGAKGFKIAANSSKWVRVKLRKKARRVLARKRKMKVKAIAKFRGPIGKSRTVKKTLTLKAPKRKKKKRRRSGGGGGGGGGVHTPMCIPQAQLMPDGTYYANPCAFVAGKR